MPDSDLLITVASWEERFALGHDANMEKYDPGAVLMYFFEEYAPWTENPRRHIEAACEKMGVKHHSRRLSVDKPQENWQTLLETLPRLATAKSRVVVDLTTMPREIIWLVLWFLQYIEASVSYVYHRPVRYNQEWLSRDPMRPRLVYKLSGTPRLGMKTGLVILPGYDVDRTAQLVTHFEPSKTLLGLQSAGIDADNERRMEEHRQKFRNDASVSTFEVDAYSSDHGEAVIRRNVDELLESHNVILSSLGPKPAAIALYRVQRSREAVGLAYGPSREFNKEYSSGIGQAIRGDL